MLESPGKLIKTSLMPLLNQNLCGLNLSICIFHFPGNFIVPPELRTMAFNEMGFICDKNLKSKVVENLYFVTFFPRDEALPVNFYVAFVSKRTHLI